MDGLKENSHSHGAFSSARRHGKTTKNHPKAVISAGDVFQEEPFTLDAAFQETLQMKIGKLCVEKGELLNQLIYLETHLAAVERSDEKENSSAFNRIVELEASAANHTQQLCQAQTEILELKSVLCNAEMENSAREKEITKQQKKHSQILQVSNRYPTCGPIHFWMCSTIGSSPEFQIHGTPFTDCRKAISPSWL